jgi:hypothetical protein
MNESEYWDGPDAPEYRPQTPEQLKEKYAYMDALIDRLDLEWVKKYLSAIMTKTSEDPTKINFIPRDKIILNPNLNVGGIFNPDDNMIEINPVTISAAVYRFQGSRNLFLLRDIIHEEAHAVSKIKKVPVGIRSGYATRTKEDKNTTWTYALFDEGVNEKLTRQITNEYIKSHPDIASDQELQAFQEIFRDDKSNGAYTLPVSLVETMITKISHETSIPQEMVWEGILRGKFEGDDLAEEDLNNLFAEIFSQEFMDQLRNTHPGRQENQIAQMIQNLDLGTLDPELWGRIQKRIKAVAELK